MQILHKFILIAACLAAFLFGTAGTLTAQDDAADAETTAAQPAEGAEGESDEPVQDDRSILDYFFAGGIVMYPLLVLSICTFTLIIYNAIMVRDKPFLRPDLAEQLQVNFSQLDFASAKQVCDDNPAVLTNIIGAGLERVDPEHLDPADVKEAMEEASTIELTAPFSMINYLQSIATLAPMVGLLGTVSGMVKAFGAISVQGMGQAQVLAGNINEALITTASGLSVAIPSMLAYLFFKNQYGKIASRVSRSTGNIYYEMLKALRRNAA